MRPCTSSARRASSVHALPLSLSSKCHHHTHPLSSLSIVVFRRPSTLQGCSWIPGTCYCDSRRRGTAPSPRPRGTHALGTELPDSFFPAFCCVRSPVLQCRCLVCSGPLPFKTTPSPQEPLISPSNLCVLQTPKSTRRPTSTTPRPPPPDDSRKRWRERRTRPKKKKGHCRIDSWTAITTTLLVSCLPFPGPANLHERRKPPCCTSRSLDTRSAARLALRRPLLRDISTPFHTRHCIPTAPTASSTGPSSPAIDIPRRQTRVLCPVAGILPVQKLLVAHVFPSISSPSCKWSITTRS